jgi:hypothetical protein
MYSLEMGQAGSPGALIFFGFFSVMTHRWR